MWHFVERSSVQYFCRRIKNPIAMIYIGCHLSVTNGYEAMGHQMGLLCRSELAVLQEQNGLYKYSDKSKMYRKKYLMESVDKELLKKQMLEVLFERDYSIFED